MLDAIIDVLNEWDPIGLISSGCPYDEYIDEAKDILFELDENLDETHLANEICNIFKCSFGSELFSYDYQTCLSIAKKCLVIKQEKI